jgi:hypothetical protein
MEPSVRSDWPGDVERNSERDKRIVDAVDTLRDSNKEQPEVQTFQSFSVRIKKLSLCLINLLKTKRICFI